MTIINTNVKNENRGIIDTLSIDESYSLLFAKKQHNGLAWISKEQYIRSDIKCNFKQCKQCFQANDKVNSNSSSSNSIRNQKEQQQILPIVIVDLEVIDQYIEILELESIITQHHLVILETIYRHIQYNSGPKFFERLRKLIKYERDGEFKTIYFTNDLFNQTIVERDQNESLESWDRSKLINAYQWYINHLKHSNPNQPIIFISNNIDKYQHRQKHIKMTTLIDYLKVYHSKNTMAIDLYDSITTYLIEKQQQQQPLNDNQSIYTRYWDDDKIQVEQKSGNIIVGKIHINAYNREEAFIKITSSTVLKQKGSNGDKVLIVGRKNINRAIHGDKVGIQLLPKSEWLNSNDDNIKLSLIKQINDIEEQDNDEKEEQNEKEEEINLQDKIGKDDSGELIMTGKVIGVLQRNWRDYICTMENGSSQSSNYIMAVPFDSRIPLIKIPTKNAQQFVQKRFTCRIDRWDCDGSAYPTGHYVGMVGQSGDLETELSCLLVENNVNLRTNWSKLILDSLPPSNWTVQEHDRVNRRILAKEGHRVMSIDPLGSKDIDDTISLARLNGDNLIEIGVHIADVSYFIKQDSPLDQEARKKGTTIYLPDRRYDMLPAILSEDLCSLWGGKERCAMSVIWKFQLSKDGIYEIVDTWFGRTIINSCGEFHYQLAQDIIDGKVVDGRDKDSDVTCGGLNAGYRNRIHNNTKIKDVYPDLLLLRKVFRQLKHKREIAGALDLESIEVRFQFQQQEKDKDKGKDKKNQEEVKPEKIILKSDLEVHQLVAEYMILANASVGTKIHSYHPNAALLRRHPDPDQRGFDSIRPLFEMNGFQFNASNNLELAHSLAMANNQNDHYVNRILKLKAVNLVSEAQYFSTGSMDNISKFYHYGLALDKYTHFTSPIRRYADIIVHRQLWDAVTNQPPTIDNFNMEALAQHLNIRHRASKTLQRDATNLFQSLYFSYHPKENVEAIITDIRLNSLVVLIPEFGLRDRIYLKDKQDNLILPKELKLQYPNAKVENIKFNETNVILTLKQNSGDEKEQPIQIKLSIFDHIMVDIKTVKESDYHLPPIKLEFIKILNINNKNSNSSSSTKHQPIQEMTKKNLIEKILEKQNNSNNNNNSSNPYGFNLEKQNNNNETNRSSSLYDIISNYKSIDINQQGSKINYPIELISPQKNQQKPNQQPQAQLNPPQPSPVLKLWSMNETQTKEYRIKEDKLLRDSISQKYKLQQQLLYGVESIDLDDEEKIAPTISAQDKYSGVIERAEHHVMKAKRDLAMARKWGNK